jgi:oxygen-independent coproporphyrinogen-3 oxidase
VTSWTKPSALYLHIPFCPYTCPYCDFVTHVGSPSLRQPYVDALCREIDMIAEYHSTNTLATVFLGGGTPGMLAPAQIGQILMEVERRFGIDQAPEITIETNPDTVATDQLTGLRAAGVNRLSLGVQSFNGHELRLLGRGHSPEDVTRAFLQARDAGFENISLDLMYGIRDQSMNSWKETLKAAIGLDPEHMSLYSLIVEPKTVYSRLEERGELILPLDDLVADMYLMACKLMQQAGFIHYEVANWARPGMESRHNTVYWHNDQFFAAGVGAHDYLRPHRSVRIRGVKRYIDRLAAGDAVIDEQIESSPAIERFETAVLGLRLLQEGLPRAGFAQRFDESLDAVYGETIAELIVAGFLSDDGETIRLREEMVPLANEAWERFLPESNS